MSVSIRIGLLLLMLHGDVAFFIRSGPSTWEVGHHKPAWSLKAVSKGHRHFTRAKPVVRFITGNKNKAREVEALLSDGGLELPFTLVPHDIELPELQEDPTVICIEKCRLAASYVGGPVLVEDTSLCFGALGGLPGPYIKHFIETLGNEGLHKMLLGYEDKSAVAICNVGFTLGPDAPPILFCGQTYGKIVEPDPTADPKTVFGWDAVFQPQSFKQRFSEMTIAQKNEISHRSLALRELQQWVAANRDEIMDKLRQQQPMVQEKLERRL